MPRPMTCRDCGRDLTDAMSRRIGIGPDCRKGMTGQQIRDAIALTAEMAKPGYIPPDRGASFEAKLTNAEARATVEAAQARAVCTRHGGLLGACAMCRQEEDPAFGVQRLIAEIRAERRAARDAAIVARRHEPVQVALEAS